MSEQIPLVDYLVLDDGGPYLVAHECGGCGARFFDRRNACAGCGGTEFETNFLASLSHRSDERRSVGGINASAWKCHVSGPRIQRMLSATDEQKRETQRSVIA